ncbi:MAG: hypothetical protein SCALA701_13080 [Candidatus Scalindua sp.]|nr:hypothetical protein [Planctomycetota bacterium]RZV80485.1 MAG: hypothetical protein EX341_10565 [Candidatus Scalindua sp. SCAELEC01]GJQ58507.1 MAG: hypothetical protein SCALA701_13080 [Candidatus Scalindua sp.]
MKKNRLKSFVLIINNLSCMVIFGLATMSLISPGFFVTHKDNSTEAESMEMQSETISKREVEFGLRGQTKSRGKNVVDTGRDVGILDSVQRGDWTFVSVLAQ